MNAGRYGPVPTDWVSVGLRATGTRRYSLSQKMLSRGVCIKEEQQVDASYTLSHGGNWPWVLARLCRRCRCRGFQGSLKGLVT